MTRRLLPLIALALVVASACASGGASSTVERKSRASKSGIPPTAATVHLPKSYKFSPKVTEISAGGEVTWINEDDFPHTVHLLDGSGVDKKLAVGKTTSIAFDDAGTYRYDCSLHPTQMKGEVIVQENS
jgi:plastocyanin